METYPANLILSVDRRYPSPDREKGLQEKALSRLEEMQLVTKIENSEKEAMYILNNPDFFTSGSGDVLIGGQIVKRTVRQVLDSVASGLVKSSKNNADVLMRIFDGQKILLEGEELSEARDFVYVPNNIDEAFNPQIIKKNKSNFVFLYKDISKSYLSDHPISTTTNRIPTFQVDVAMMVYGMGDAKREKDGTLTVLKDVNNPNLGRQRISGKWFINNFGFTNMGGERWDKPRSMVAKFGDQLEERGLLTQKDFEQPERKLQVSKNGHLMYKGDNYSLFKFSGMEVREGPDGVLEIVDDNKVVASFRPGVKKGLESLVRVVSLDKLGKTRRFIPQGAIDFVEVNSGKLILTKFDEGGRTSVNLDSSEISFFKNKCVENGLSNVSLGYVSDQDLLAASEIFKDLDEEQRMICWKFIEKYEEFGLRYLSESFYQNNINIDLIVKSISSDESVRPILESYYYLQSNVAKMKNSILGSVTDASSREVAQLEIFVSRMEEALRIRSKELLDGLTLAPSAGISQQLKLLDRAVRSIGASTLEGEGMSPQSNKPSVFENSRTTRIFIGYDEMEGTRLVVTIRPEKSIDTGDKGVGQPRIQFRFIDVDEQEINLRFDLDSKGTSLDIGSHEGVLRKLLNRLNTSHHTHFPFEKQFSNPQTFARVAKTFSSIFDMNIWK